MSRAQAEFYAERGEGYASLEELVAAGLLDDALGARERGGYTFQVVVGGRGAEARWLAVASPKVPSTTGDRYFHVDATGLISYQLEGAFDADLSAPLPLTARFVGQ